MALKGEATHTCTWTFIRNAPGDLPRDGGFYDFNATGSFQVNERVYALQDAVFNVTGLVTRYTISGDGTGDGSVNMFDLTIMSAHWQQYVSGGAVNGDFNNDGFVNAFDSNILSVNWNSTGNTATWIVTQRHAYGSYGQVQTMKEDWAVRSDYLAWNYTFQGGRQDALTGNIHFQMRDYNPRTMTWNTQDPLGFVDGMNLYQLVTNNPINRRDPSGLKEFITVSGIHGNVSINQPTNNYIGAFVPDGSHSNVGNYGSTVSLATIVQHLSNVKDHLDGEAAIQSPLVSLSILKNCMESRIYDVAIVFFAPKTTLPPVQQIGKFRFHYLVWFDHEDWVPNQGIFEPGNGLLGANYWQQTFGGIDVSFDDWNHHGTQAAMGLQDKARRHGFPFGQWFGQEVDFSAEVDLALKDADFGVLAHSQGTNITLQALSQLN